MFTVSVEAELSKSKKTFFFLFRNYILNILFCYARENPQVSYKQVRFYLHQNYYIFIGQ